MAVFGVVKADAYGHGAVPVASVLESLVDGMAVSLVEEGIELRDAGISKPILVLGAYYGHYHSEVLEGGLTPVIYDAGDFERFGQAPVRRRPHTRRNGGPRAGAGRFPVHVKIDTGMNRLGLDLEAIPGLAAVAARFPQLAIDGLCTHLASADLASPDATLAQLARFDQAIATARAHAVLPRVIHAANSAGMARFPQARFSAIRPGLALYGSHAVRAWWREPISNRCSACARASWPCTAFPWAGRSAMAGAGRPRASRPSRPCPSVTPTAIPGTAEGAEVLVRGQRAKVVGAVCMDMMMVDVTDVAGAAVGDDAVIIGCSGQECIRAEDLARWSGTISYEILCGISKRVPRIYGRARSRMTASGAAPTQESGSKPAAGGGVNPMAIVGRAFSPLPGAIALFGEHVILLFRSVIWLFRPPFRLRLFLDQMEFVGVGSLPIVMLVGFFTGAVTALQAILALSLFEQQRYVGFGVGISLARELAPGLHRAHDHRARRFGHGHRARLHAHHRAGGRAHHLRGQPRAVPGDAPAGRLRR